MAFAVRLSHYHLVIFCAEATWPVIKELFDTGFWGVLVFGFIAHHSNSRHKSVKNRGITVGRVDIAGCIHTAREEGTVQTERWQSATARLLLATS